MLTPESLATLVRLRYTEPDTEVGGLSPIRRLGALQATPEDLAPPSDSCDTHFAMQGHTYCFRQHYGEPFQLRRIDQRAVSNLSWADSLTRETIGDVAFDSLRNLLDYGEVVRTSDVACVEVAAIEKPLDSATITYDAFWATPASRLMLGLACRAGSQVMRGLPLSRERLESWRLWDRYPVGSDTLWIVHGAADECSWFLVLRQMAARLTEIGQLDLGCL